VGAVYTTKRSSSEIRSQATSSTTDLGSRPKFGQQLWLEAPRRGLPQAKTVVFLGDGAPWLWEMARDLFPQAFKFSTGITLLLTCGLSLMSYTRKMSSPFITG
jgi:hypothetical protein